AEPDAHDDECVYPHALARFVGDVTNLADVSGDDLAATDLLSVHLRAAVADARAGERRLQRALSAGHHLADDRVDRDAGGFDAAGDRIRLYEGDRRPVLLPLAGL